MIKIVKMYKNGEKQLYIMMKKIKNDQKQL